GSDLKAKLSAAVFKEGVRVLERTMIGDIITKDGTAVGATAFNMRTGELILINAKSVLISTGRVTRLYPYPYVMYPQNLFYSVGFSGNSGGGVMAALNAGAKIHNMEFIWMYAVSRGSNISSGSGGAGWFFPIRKSNGELLEHKYPERNMMKHGGNIPPINFMYAPSCQNPEIEHDYLTSHMANAEDHEVTAIQFCAATEKPRSLKFHWMAGGVRNIRPIEAISLCAGLTINGIKRENEYGETSLKNLYAAGDCAGHTAGCRALTWGWIVGNHVAETADEMNQPNYGPDQLKQVAASKDRIYAPLNRSVTYAVNPLELEDYVRNLNAQFVGVHKIEPRLKYAVEQMRWLKEAAVPAISVKTYHELMRALEVQDIVELSEMHAYTSLMRDESRMPPIHNRDDYPEQNPKWDNKTIVATKVNGEIVYTVENVN
ncbi:MAG: FAD-binding protein, partial [Firmicutes bacterium]|nr:FAD-binding protein [Bacillota bacterium]